MPFDINNPCCILPILLFACHKPADIFSTYARVSSEFYDTIENYGGADAIIQKIGITETPEHFLQNLSLGSSENKNCNNNNDGDDGDNNAEDSDYLKLSAYSGYIKTADSRNGTAVNFSLRRFHSHLRQVEIGTRRNVSKQLLDLRFLWNIRIIGNAFLASHNLRYIDFSSSFDNVVEIEDSFLAGSTGLQILHLGGFRNLARIGKKFLFECEALQEIRGLELLYPEQKLHRHNSYERARNQTMQHDEQQCKHEQEPSLSMQIVSASDLMMKSIGSEFLARCGRLESFDAGFLEGIAILPTDFMSACASCVEVKNFSRAMRFVKTIGNFCFTACESLRELDFSLVEDGGEDGGDAGKSISLVEKIGAGFLDHCPSLRRIDLRPLNRSNLRAEIIVNLWGSVGNQLKFFLPDSMQDNVRFASKELIALNKKCRDQEEKEKMQNTG